MAEQQSEAVTENQGKKRSSRLLVLLSALAVIIVVLTVLWWQGVISWPSQNQEEASPVAIQSAEQEVAAPLISAASTSVKTSLGFVNLQAQVMLSAQEYPQVAFWIAQEQRLYDALPEVCRQKTEDLNKLLQEVTTQVQQLPTAPVAVVAKQMNELKQLLKSAKRNTTGWPYRSNSKPEKTEEQSDTKAKAWSFFSSFLVISHQEANEEGVLVDHHTARSPKSLSRQFLQLQMAYLIHDYATAAKLWQKIKERIDQVIQFDEQQAQQYEAIKANLDQVFIVPDSAIEQQLSESLSQIQQWLEMK